jgi:hypothetical protein
LVSWVGPAGRSIRDVCENLFAALPTSESFTLQGFVASVGEVLGRRVEAVAVKTSATMSCGGLVTTPEVTLVWYPANTNALHQVHVALHEVGHLALDHPGQPVALSADSAHVVMALQRLMPDVPAELIRRVLRRGTYDDEPEREAEQFATIAGPRLHRMIAESRSVTPHDMDVQRLRPLFAVPPGFDHDG